MKRAKDVIHRLSKGVTSENRLLRKMCMWREKDASIRLPSYSIISSVDMASYPSDNRSHIASKASVDLMVR
jgi:hypothetical protein